MRIEYKKICPSCNVDYTTFRKDQKVCSRTCRKTVIQRICPTCKLEFNTQPSVNQKFCSRKCITRSEEYKRQLSNRLKADYINSEGWFSRESLRKKNESCRKYRESTSYKNPMKGRSRNQIWMEKYGEEEGKKKIQEYKERCKQWTIFKKGQTLEERFGREFAIKFRKLLSDLQKQRRPSELFDAEKHNYYLSVLQITSIQRLELLENYNKRGKLSRNPGAYHLDHIIPIKFGYDNNISPHYIGHIDNLRFIPALDNISNSECAS